MNSPSAQAGKLKLSETEKGVLLRVRAVPGSSRNRILGIYADALKIAVCAPALEGKANRSLLRILAKSLGIKRSTVSIHSGMTSRNKCFLLESITEKEARKMVSEVLQE